MKLKNLLLILVLALIMPALYAQRNQCFYKAPKGYVYTYYFPWNNYFYLANPWVDFSSYDIRGSYGPSRYGYW